MFRYAVFLLVVTLTLTVGAGEALGQRSANARVSVSIGPPLAGAAALERAVRLAMTGAPIPASRTMPAGATLVASATALRDRPPIRRLTLLYAAN